MVSKGYGLGGSCFPAPENLAVSLECGVFVCVVNFTWRMRLGCPALRAMHPQSQGQARCKKCSKRKAGWAGPPAHSRALGALRRSQKTLLSRADSALERFSPRVPVTPSRSSGTSSGVITDLARCPPSPGVRCPRGDGPLCLRPLCGLAVSLSRTSLGQVPPPLNLEHPEVAGRCGTPKEATAVRTAYLCARPRCPGASLSLRLPGWA